MRTSKISRETNRIFSALSPNSQRRSTRSAAKGLATFALGYDGAAEEIKREEHAATVESTPSAAVSDIEDIASPSQRSRKRKRSHTATPAKIKGTTITATEDEVTWTSPRRRIKKEDPEDSDASQITDSPRQKAKPKIPAKRVQAADGTYHYTPPANWEELYNIIHAQRRRNPTAPVDTMGCEDLFWHTAPPREKRYHTLTALMLSSQTKDTVTAAAMQRLHTELVPQHAPVTASSLTVGNILACDPVHLDSLIGKVGFHNNKTKYIKAAAQILHDEYASDIPNTIEGLTRLPGVGPKMAYLCMSAAWGIDEGIGVDVHVHRITNLWGWHKTKSPEETRMWLEGWLPKNKWHEINKMLVGLGQTVCLPIGRRCGECDAAGTGLCKAEIRGWKATERRVKKTVEVQIDGSVKEEVKEHVAVEVKHELAEQT